MHYHTKHVTSTLVTLTFNSRTCVTKSDFVFITIIITRFETLFNLNTQDANNHGHLLQPTVTYCNPLPHTVTHCHIKYLGDYIIKTELQKFTEIGSWLCTFFLIDHTTYSRHLKRLRFHAFRIHIKNASVFISPRKLEGRICCTY